MSEPSAAAVAEPALHRIRVDTIGSLLRPDALKRAFEDHDAGRCSDEDLKAAQDEAIRHVIQRQEALGLPVVTDGEFRRRHFNESFAYVSGFANGELTPISMSRRKAESSSSSDSPPAETSRQTVTSRLRLVRSRPLEEYLGSGPFASRPLKATLINPDGIVQRFDIAGGAYESSDELLDDIVEIEREMIAELIEAGCRYIQVDAPRYGVYLDERWTAQLRARGEDPERLLARAVEAENRLIRGFPEDVTFALHICRGNNRGRWLYEGSYARIAGALAGARHDRLLLEYDSERAGGFEPLNDIDPGTVVVLGLISSKSNELESEDDLLRRIEDAATHLPLEQLALSPQCGFATVIEGNALTEDMQWRKLELMMKVAERVWGGQ